MKRLLPVLLMFAILCSCSKDNPGSLNHQLKNCHVEYLYFRDEIRTSSAETIEFPMSQEPLVCTYSYKDGNIKRNTGNFIFVPHGTNLAVKLFSYQAYDSLIHQNGTVVSYTKYTDSEGNNREYSTNPIVYFFGSLNRIEKITRKSSLDANTIKYSYLHFQDSIREMINDSIPGRVFHFNGPNLEKVVTVSFFQGKMFARKEMLFENYDQNPNPLKGLYYLPGAFYRAFSNNNYRGVRINQYGYLADSTFGLVSTFNYSVTISYDPEGYPIFGEYY